MLQVYRCSHKIGEPDSIGEGITVLHVSGLLKVAARYGDISSAAEWPGATEPSGTRMKRTS